MKGAIGKLWAINLDDELKTYKRKVDCLTAVESDNLTVLKNAEIQPGKKQKSEVELWFANVNEKKSELQRIETEFREKGPSRNLKSRIKKETKEVEELTQQGKFPTGVVLDDHESTRIPMVTTTLVGQSCNENIDSILKLLKEDSVFAIGVYGMGGVGKTTLMKQIHNRLLKDSGTAVYWVTASQDCSLEKLQKEIGKVVGLDLSEEDKERKKALLFHELSMKTESVIILDDLWKHYLPEQVGIPLDSRSCKIVMTTRLEDVCSKMGCQKIIKIEPLCKNDAWKLFAKHLEAIPSHFNQLAEEIVKECGGLPLALITMGYCARAYDTIHDWENALYELRRPVSRQELMEEEVFRVLKFSFDSLKDQKVQDCFLCCAFYPEDYCIRKEYLVDLWIDAGLLDEVPSPQDKVSRGYAILNRLLRSCLLESTTVISVRMHDLVRDMATIITQNHPCFMAKSGEDQMNVPEKELWTKDLEKVSLISNNIREIPNGMAPLVPGLTVLMLNRNPLRGIPESFFMHMRALTVLDLSDTDIVRLPESVSDLENLRALLLASCWRLTYVPSLAKLSNLRVLDLDCAGNLEKAPEGIEKLKCLEEVSYWPWDISDSTGFNKLIQSSLSSLSFYRFWLHDPKLIKTIDDVFDYDLQEDFWNYKNVVLIGGAKIGDDKTTYLLPATIERLKICRCEVNRRNLGDVFPTLGLATDLKVLRIKRCKGLKYISSTGPQQCSFIENIHLDNLPDLRGIIEFGRCTFSHLCDLDISACPKLKVILPLSVTLPNLKQLSVSECEELEEIFESNNANHPNSAFSHLCHLKITVCPKLKVIFPLSVTLPNLKQLSVSCCEELEEIFESNNANHPNSAFSHLCHLKISVCPKLKVIFPLSVTLPNLKQRSVSYCEELEEIFESNNANHPNSAFSHLCHLEIRACPKLKVIFPLSVTLPNLKQLDVLSCVELEEIFESNNANHPNSVFAFRNCKELEEIFENGGMNACNPQHNPISALPILERIDLEDLPKLGSIYKNLHLCTSLQQLEVVDCPKIERIFEAPEPILALPNLWKLKLPRLSNLSSIHRGLLLCTSLRRFLVKGCFRLNRVPLSNHLICDNSSSSLLSLPSESDNPELWKLLWRDYSEDARLLSDFIQYHVELEEHNQNQLKLKRKWSDPEDNVSVFTDYINQVSLPASLPTADDDDVDEQNEKTKWGASLSLSLPPG